MTSWRILKGKDDDISGEYNENPGAKAGNKLFTTF
jgi:hypothetical protein